MLATISRLQDERQELRTRLGELNLQARACTCTPAAEDRRDTFSKYLRADSYRKALIWQKRYLLVQLSGGYFEAEPVLKVGRQQLKGRSRFRAVVQLVLSIHRMKFLVKRWRSGKRGGAKTSRLTTPLQSPASPSAFHRPDSFKLPLFPPPPASFSPRDSPLSPREPSGRVRRASSLRERVQNQPSTGFRERALGRSLESPSSVSSTSSILHTPVITGRTPPTRDTGRRVGPGEGTESARRSLGNQLASTRCLADPAMEADLKDYLDRFHHLEQKLGVKF